MPPSRSVLISGLPPPNYEVLLPQQQQKYPDNRVVTSKYTVWNFLPKNLFEQFRRAANFYFLCVAIIQLVIDSPVSPLTSITPLCFVVGVTAVKQAYEDWLRHKADNEVNTRPAYVVQGGQITEISSQDIKVGDIVLVRCEEGFPCDLVLLSSSEPDGECHITTVNLDGETNLKLLYSAPETRTHQTAESLSTVRGVIECEGPSPDLYKFVGRIQLHSQGGDDVISPLGPESLLLRGARLKNTAFIYGCAVYTGQETKMALNSRLTSNKFSTIERTMNMYLLLFLMILILEVAVSAITHYTYKPKRHEFWYLPPEKPTSPQEIIQTTLSFLVILNYNIPISMYVTIEMQKFFGSMFFAWDLDLYDAETNSCAKCSTSDLNEELGQVQYLFTDKTGTLTENDMRFRQCSINGKRYVEHRNELCAVPELTKETPERLVQITKEVELFLVALSLCHTVQLNGNNNTEPATPIPNGLPEGSEHTNDPVYQASSPDEKALVEACHRFSVTFKGVSDGIMEVTFRGVTRLFKRLHTLEFSSDRKCMSVIVQDLEDGSTYLFCKGAESAVLSKCSTGPVSETMKHVNDYAVFGLRTLVVAYKKITDEDMALMNQELQTARISMTDRDSKVEQSYNVIEQDLHLLGAVGIEDRLQEGVPETLEKLRIAGIKVWVLTGDKMETAVNISMSCGHFKRAMTQLSLTCQRTLGECRNTMEELLRRINGDPMQPYGLVIDGISLAYALHESISGLLLDISTRCQAVVCCRMSPLQKAEVVRLIKQRAAGKPVTAAIGDGANDCSMIQEAHVGLGIMGKEGRQAVRCSDFSFARFKFLQKVFFVHGHYYYIRVATLVQYFFYKNVAFITPQLYFVLCTGYSSQTLYDGAYLTLYNIFFAALPIFIFGLFEQNVSAKTLMDNPILYRKIACNAKLTMKQFVKWNICGVWHSVVSFFTVYALLDDSSSISPTAKSLGNWDFGTIVYHIVVVLVNLKLLMESRFITAIFVASIVISLLTLIIFTMAYNAIIWSLISNYSMYWIYFTLLASPAFWMLMVVAIVMGLIPDVLFVILGHSYWHVSHFLRQVWMPTYRQRPRIFFFFSKRSDNLTISQTNIIES